MRSALSHSSLSVTLFSDERLNDQYAALYHRPIFKSVRKEDVCAYRVPVRYFQQIRYMLKQGDTRTALQAVTALIGKPVRLLSCAKRPFE